jgi:hypothetical protein
MTSLAVAEVTETKEAMMRSIQRVGTLVSAAILSAQLAACSGSPSSDRGTMAQAAPDTVSRTVVRIQPDGTRKAITSIISREEQLLEISRKKALEIAAASKGERLLTVVQDYSCAASSMWLFSNTNRSGNEICFLQDGNNLPAYYWEDLSTYNSNPTFSPNCSPEVGGCVMSAWGGSDVACLAADDNGGFQADYTNFEVFEANDNVAAWKTLYLYIGMQCRSHIG